VDSLHAKRAIETFMFELQQIDFDIQSDTDLIARVKHLKTLVREVQQDLVDAT